MRRFASKVQRVLAYRLQGGRCAICGKDLPDSFHMDHVVPFSCNGETYLCNLQALCPACHSLKTSGKDSVQWSKR